MVIGDGMGPYRHAAYRRDRRIHDEANIDAVIDDFGFDVIPTKFWVEGVRRYENPLFHDG